MLPAPPTTLTLAANNGEMGGGEVMLLAAARAASELGTQVRVVGPAHEHGVLSAARAAGYDSVELAPGRRDYLRQLRAWDARERQGLLWCHGLVPAVATAGHPNRVVELHQLPTGRAQRLASALGRRGAVATLVPSHDMARALPGTEAMWNWTAPISIRPTGNEPGITRIGFLGRLSVDKGLPVLAAALGQLRARGTSHRYRLVIAGEPRFVSADQKRVVQAALEPVRDLVRFTGWIDRAEFFGQIDLAVFPSVWPESFGLVVAESMSARVPFVISDAGALPEVAGPEHPWVFPAGNVDGLVHAIESARQADLTTLERVTGQAFERWEADFSPTAGRERVGELLRATMVRAI